VEKTLTIKLAKKLSKVKSHISELMNCIPLIVGVHLYLSSINHSLAYLWVGPLLGLVDLLWAVRAGLRPSARHVT